MGLLDAVMRKNKEVAELAWMMDLELFEKTSTRVHMKRLAIDTCVAFLARTISQAEWRVRHGDNFVQDELYYRLNTRPNKNMTASTFWQTVMFKLAYNNEVLIIQADDGDLLIADEFEQKEYAVYEDSFSKVKVRGFEFETTFPQSKVIHLRYSNEALTILLDSLWTDYGDLFGSLVSGHRRKNQIRATVDMDMIAAKSREHQQRLQEFITNMYKAIEEKDVAIIPQQPGFTYKETTGGNGNNGGVTIEEINKATGGYFDQVALAFGIPLGLIKGNLADAEVQTKNFMFFTVSPLLKKVQDEANVKFFTKQEYMANNRIEVRTPIYRDMFDLSTAVDKLRSSGVMNANEIRDRMGLSWVDDDSMNQYVLTKNYAAAEETLNTAEGGETNEGES